MKRAHDEYVILKLRKIIVIIIITASTDITTYIIMVIRTLALYYNLETRHTFI
jgi:hypothetical protein